MILTPHVLWLLGLHGDGVGVVVHGYADVVVPGVLRAARPLRCGLSRELTPAERAQAVRPYNPLPVQHTAVYPARRQVLLDREKKVPDQTQVQDRLEIDIYRKRR